MWRRLGLLIPPPCGLGGWAATHATLPVVLSPGATLALLFSPRDGEGRSHTVAASIGFARDRESPTVSPEPVLTPGPLGAFDDSGAMGSCLVGRQSDSLLFYIGWTRGGTVPFHTAIGCAVSTDGCRSFERVSAAPVLGRNRHDPFLATSPWVIADGGAWRMWYASGTEWREASNGAKHFYNIRHAESEDGIQWRTSGQVCIDFRDASEYAIARPCVVKDGETYRMWFSYRGDRYRIGYAESRDGLAWKRLDGKAGLDVAASGWDAEMVEYPCIFDYEGSRYMLYNGNGYGETGIGLAMLEPK